MQHCRLGTELPSDPASPGPPLSRSAPRVGSDMNGGRQGTHRPHPPGQRDGAVCRSSPDALWMGKKGLQKTSSPWLGLVSGSQAIRLLLALALQHTSSAMSQSPPQATEQASTTGGTRKLPLNKRGLAGTGTATRLGMLREGTCSQGPWLQKHLPDSSKEAMHPCCMNKALPCPADMGGSWDTPQEGKGMPSAGKLPGRDSPCPGRVMLQFGIVHVPHLA